jgi:hypothetical protein
LKKAGDLPTANEYTASEREKEWTARQKAGRKGSSPGARTDKRELVKRAKAKFERATAGRGQKSEPMTSSPGRRKKVFAGLGLLFLVAGALAAWSVSAGDVPGIGTSPFASEEGEGQSSSASETESTASGDVFVTDNLNTPLDEPTTILYGNHLRFVNMEWENWGEEPAEGTGTVQTIDCDPSCGTGKPVEEPVVIRLSEIDPCNGRSQYTAMVVESEHVGVQQYKMPPLMQCAADGSVPTQHQQASVGETTECPEDLSFGSGSLTDIAVTNLNCDGAEGALTEWIYSGFIPATGPHDFTCEVTQTDSGSQHDCRSSSANRISFVRSD